MEKVAPRPSTPAPHGLPPHATRARPDPRVCVRTYTQKWERRNHDFRGNANFYDFYTDADGDGAGAGDPISLCDEFAPSNMVTNNNDSDDACYSNVHDCAGVCDGTAWISDCGCVTASNLGDDCDDCAGVPNGLSVYDNCGEPVLKMIPSLTAPNIVILILQMTV